MPATELDKDRFRRYGVDTPEFTLLGTECYARCVYAYDGDSPTIVIPLFGGMFKFHTRMHGIDTSEIRSALNKERAVRARNRLLELVTKSSVTGIANKADIVSLLASDVFLVWVRCLGMDKYGRVLVQMSASPEDTKDFAQILIEENLGYAYGGGRKRTEADQTAASC